MRWIVGLDLRPQGAGAIEMARWLAEHAAGPDKLTLIGVHVVARDGAAVRNDVLDELCGRRRERAEAMLREAGARAAFDRVEAVPGDDAAQTLAAAVRYHHADGILIGRQAPRESHGLVRLGRCARRLIRALPAAVMVVPPHTACADIGDGPVVMASDLGEASTGAAHMSLRVARLLARDLVVVSAWRSKTPASAEWDSLVDDHAFDDADPDAAERWLVEQGLGGAIGVRERGDPVEATLRVGHERDAVMLACGSRHLTLGQRVFIASTGTDLARVSKAPVLIVPPEAKTGA